MPDADGLDCHTTCHPQPPNKGEGDEEAPPRTPCHSPWVLDELQFLLEPPPATQPYHLVLEAARELPAEERRWLIQALEEED